MNFRNRFSLDFVSGLAPPHRWFKTPMVTIDCLPRRWLLNFHQSYSAMSKIYLYRPRSIDFNLRLIHRPFFLPITKLHQVDNNRFPSITENLKESNIDSQIKYICTIAKLQLKIIFEYFRNTGNRIG